MYTNWIEIVETLKSYVNKNSIESEYQKEIENCLKILGWKKSNNTMQSQFQLPIGNGNFIRIDIVLNSILPIEIKRPSNICSVKQESQLMSYMRQLRSNVGLYIGENIQLFYDNPNDKDSAISVFKVDLSEEDINGVTICELLDFKNFDIQKLEYFCQKHYDEIVIYKKFQQCFAEFFSVSNVNKNIQNLIKDKFIRDGFDEDLLDSELQKLTINVQRNDSSFIILKANCQREKLDIESTIRKSENADIAYLFNGNLYKKNKPGYGIGRLVLHVIKQFVKDNPDITLEQLNLCFPADLCHYKSYNAFIVEKECIDEGDKGRFFLNERDIIVLQDFKKITVSNQWGDEKYLKKYFQSFLEKAREYYPIYEK